MLQNNADQRDWKGLWFNFLNASIIWENITLCRESPLNKYVHAETTALYSCGSCAYYIFQVSCVSIQENYSMFYFHTKKSVQGNILLKSSHSKTLVFALLDIRCNFTISEYFLHINWQNCVDLPEPTGINMPVHLRMVFESALLIPRSAFHDLPWAWLDNVSGTRHRWEPLRHPMPKDERWAGQIVIREISSGAVNIDARAKIRSISDSTSLTPTDWACAEMSFPHESNGSIRAPFSFARLLLSWEHCPPTTLWKEQLISIPHVFSVHVFVCQALFNASTNVYLLVCLFFFFYNC